jgi:hypothetical protein
MALGQEIDQETRRNRMMIESHSQEIHRNRMKIECHPAADFSSCDFFSQASLDRGERSNLAPRCAEAREIFSMAS